MYIAMYIKYRYSCHFLMKLEISRKIFVKSANIKFYENPHKGAELFHADGQT